MADATGQGMGDSYEGLGPAMRARLDFAEVKLAVVQNYIGILAQRDRAAHLIAQELCLVLSLAPPRPRAWIEPGND